MHRASKELIELLRSPNIHNTVSSYTNCTLNEFTEQKAIKALKLIPAPKIFTL